MRKFIVTLVILSFVVSIYGQTKFTVNGIDFTTKNSSMVEVSRRTDYAGNITIPSSVVYNSTTYQVNSIATSAFRDCAELTGITIPNSITAIGAYAFHGCTGLTSVTLPPALTHIDSYLFANCTNLVSVNIPSSVTIISNQAFRSCTSLEDLFIPASVHTLGSYAFGLSTANFIVDENNNFFSSDNGVLFNKSKTHLIQCPPTKTGIYEIPASVTMIRDLAFEYAEELTGIIIPESVTSIGGYAFRNCIGLTEMSIPTSVLSIGTRAFMDCSGLTTVDISGPLTTIEDLLFMNCTSLESFAFPATITTINDKAFFNCVSLSNLNIPASVTWVSSGALAGVSGPIEVSPDNNDFSSEDGVLYNKTKTALYQCPVSIAGNFEIPSTVTRISACSFYNCSALTNISIPNSITQINAYTFSGCTGLTSIELPASITQIGNNAFENCFNLEHIRSNNPIPPTLGWNVFQHVEKDACVLSVPMESIAVYSNTNQWKDFLNILAINDITTNTNIGSYNVLQLYPNPFTNYITIEGTATKGELRLYDTQGKLKLRELVSDGDKISVSTLPNGVYHYLFQNQEGINAGKLLKNMP